MKLARIYLIAAGIMTLGFGAWYLVAPLPMTDAAGFGPLPKPGITDVRATYGGFQLGMGLFLLWSAQREARFRSALLLMALSIGAVGASRAIGLMIDGEINAFHRSGLVTEALLTVCTLLVLRRI